jgi:hypothetical protein
LMQFLLKFYKNWYKVLQNRTKRSFSHIASFTMGQNYKFMAKIFFVPNCQIFAEND